jgi:hypothetical protein
MIEYTTTDEDMDALAEMAAYGTTVTNTFYVFAGDDGIVQVQFKIGSEDDEITVGAYAMATQNARTLARLILDLTEDKEQDEIVIIIEEDEEDEEVFDDEI